MINAERILSQLSGTRSLGEDRWSACCPAHHDDVPSLSITSVDGRVLLYCHAGCTVGEILAALGLSLTHLFDEPLQSIRFSPLPRVDYRRRVAAEFQTWRREELRQCAEELRIRDLIIRHIDRAVQAGVLSEDEAMVSLSYEYNGYSDLTYRFERLRTGTDREALEVYRAR